MELLSLENIVTRRLKLYGILIDITGAAWLNTTDLCEHSHTGQELSGISLVINRYVDDDAIA